MYLQIRQFMYVEIISQVSFPGSSLGPYTMNLFSSFATSIFSFKRMSFNFRFSPVPTPILWCLLRCFSVLHLLDDTVVLVFLPVASIDEGCAWWCEPKSSNLVSPAPQLLQIPQLGHFYKLVIRVNASVYANIAKIVGQNASEGRPVTKHENKS